MNTRRWMGDTIARRFVLTIILAFAATAAMNAVFVSVSGVWGNPPITETGLINEAAAIIRVTEAQPPEVRRAIVAAAETPNYRVDWYADGAPIEPSARLESNNTEALDQLRALLRDERRTALFFDADSPEISTARLGFSPDRDSSTYFMAVELRDRSWLVFTVPERRWGMSPATRRTLKGLFAAVSILVLATITARSLARPVERLAEGVRRFGTDPQAPPIKLQGPAELRETIRAFNAMQARIARFVQDRTMMLAAISHDLRTPLTRMRLRAELIEDPLMQAKLFRDVDEMQGMVDSALAFFRDDASHEPATGFDLPELLKSIVDDFGDQGLAVQYAGPDHAVHFGRPLALRRAFVNLVDNAVKYATPPLVTLEMGPAGADVSIRDHGAGIAEAKLEQVFLPFQRLDPSRNRATGGVGLGLTTARSIIREHGGDVTLRNCPDGGLEVAVALPYEPQGRQVRQP
ncbi:ATP-binding protein [Roseomonas sp. WA12]